MPRAIVESTPEEEEESETEQSSRGAGPSSKRGAAAANADEDQSEDADEMDVDEGGEGEGEDEVDDDAEGEEGEEEVDVDGEEEEEEEEEEEAPSEPEEAYSAPSRSRRSKASSAPSRAAKSLKITLKLPHKTTRGRRARVVESTDPSEPPSRDVESEDEDAEGEEEDEDDEEVMPGSSSRNLTARQAVLASVVDSSHVSLDDTAPSRKKKQLNEAELALRREETARKRKHMSEKKLEDEKAETINRLLKKQSRPRNKRNALATADDRTPATQTNAAGTPDRDEETGEIAPIPIEIPTMYRWISTSRPIFTPEESGKDQPPVSEPRMTLSFSVPLDALPEASSENASASDASMDVDTPSRKMTPHCVAPGCDRISKYRLRNDFLRGVCGIEHLKLLEQAAKAR